MADKFFQNHPQVPFVDRNQQIQTLAPDGPDQPFAIGVGQGSQLQLMATLPTVVLKSSIHIIR